MSNLGRTINFFANAEFHRLPENRPGKGEGMELAIFTARIHFRRQCADKFLVQLAAHGVFAEIGVVGRFEVSTDRIPPGAVSGARDQHDDGQRHQQPAPAALVLLVPRRRRD